MEAKFAGNQLGAGGKTAVKTSSFGATIKATIMGGLTPFVGPQIGATVGSAAGSVARGGESMNTRAQMNKKDRHFKGEITRDYVAKSFAFVFTQDPAVKEKITEILAKKIITKFIKGNQKIALKYFGKLSYNMQISIEKYIVDKDISLQKGTLGTLAKLRAQKVYRQVTHASTGRVRGDDPLYHLANNYADIVDQTVLAKINPQSKVDCQKFVEELVRNVLKSTNLRKSNSYNLAQGTLTLETLARRKS